jgi:hypothetical protein
MLGGHESVRVEAFLDRFRSSTCVCCCPYAFVFVIAEVALALAAGEAEWSRRGLPHSASCVPSTAHSTNLRFAP